MTGGLLSPIPDITLPEVIEQGDVLQRVDETPNVGDSLIQCAQCRISIFESTRGCKLIGRLLFCKICFGDLSVEMGDKKRKQSQFKTTKKLKRSKKSKPKEVMTLDGSVSSEDRNHMTSDDEFLSSLMSLDSSMVNSPFEVTSPMIESGFFTLRRSLDYGEIFVLLSLSGKIRTFYQHVGDHLKQLRDAPGCLLVASLFNEPTKGEILVLTEGGIKNLFSMIDEGSCLVEPVWPLVPAPIDFDKGFSLPSSKSKKLAKTSPSIIPFVEDKPDSAEDDEIYDDGSLFVKDLSSIPVSSHLKYRESVAFRVMCFNIKLKWKKLAGEYCSVDTGSTIRNVSMLIPEGLRELAGVKSFLLVALLQGQFASVSFSPKFNSVPKKGDNVHLGHFLFPNESIFKVPHLSMLLQRLVTTLGNIFGDKIFFQSVFTDVLGVLCPSNDPNSMSGWSTAYVFKWLSQKLNLFGWFLGQDSSTTLDRELLLNGLKDVLCFNFVHETTLYLASNEFRLFTTKTPFVPKNATKTSSTSLPLSPSAASSTGVVSTPQSAQWCLTHVNHSLKLITNPCVGDKKTGGACARVHPVISLPLSVPHKEKLKSMANIIKEPTFKGKFLLAIA